MPTCQHTNLPGRIDRYSALRKGHILSVHTSAERIRRHPSIHQHIRSLIRLLQSPPVLVGSVNAEPRTYLQNALPLGARELRPTLILPRYLQMVMTEPCRQIDIHPSVGEACGREERARGGGGRITVRSSQSPDMRAYCLPRREGLRTTEAFCPSVCRGRGRQTGYQGSSQTQR